MKCLMMFNDYDKNALLLTVLSYNIGADRLKTLQEEQIIPKDRVG